MTAKGMKRTEWTREDKQQAAVQYAICGSLKQIEDELGIPDATVNGWRGKDWFIETVSRVRSENDDKILARASNIIELAQARTVEAMPQATAAQASIIGATWVDKGRLIRNQPTSIRGDSSTVTQLAQDFRKLYEDHEAIQNSVVATQDATHSATHSDKEDL